MNARDAASVPPDYSATRRTLLALLAGALGVVPLTNLLTDSGWLVDVWLAMLVTVGPAALLRLRRPPSALDVWPGVLLLIPWLTLRFVPDNAWGHFVPTTGTVHDISALMTDLHDTTTNEVAPVHSTVAIRLVLCALLALLAALVDLIAVVARRGALAGVPLLVVYTVAGAVPRDPVSWAAFVVAAAGFLVLLGLDAEDELHRWGRRIPRRDSARTRLAMPFSAPRIGVLAILVAVLLPLLVPAQPRNLIADAFHNGNSGGNGDGNGSGTGGISPFATLKGQLTRDQQINLFSVQVENWRTGKRTPGYMRTDVLDDYTGKGWVVGPPDSLGSVKSPRVWALPAGQGDSVAYSVRFDVSGLNGTPPLFPRSTSHSGLDVDAHVNEEFQVVTGARVSRGQTYHETFAEPVPTRAQLARAGSDPVGANPWLQLPSIPSQVHDLVNKLTAGKATPYAKARAISDYFADPTNGFQYSLKTKDGDSGSDLVDFLKNKVGYCQQYAAAMGVMLRLAGIPARVVLGYMHPVPDEHGRFTVTTFDAHAWVEGYFEHVGWTPFDPTPVDGLDGGPQSDLTYAPHVYAGGDPQRGLKSGNNTALANTASSSGATSSSAPVTQSRASAPVDRTPAWVALGVLGGLLLALTPAAVRVGRRRRRIAAARHGDPDPLWQELSDTAVDLGYVWSPARSPRQVASWLARDSGEPAALQALAVAVEQRRYSPDVSGRDSAELERGLKRIVGQLRAGRRGSTRLRARFWPASLGLGRRLFRKGTSTPRH